MTGSLAAVPAVGAAHAAWLLLAFPSFGAAVLLLGGKRTNAWGHLLGVTMSLASFVYGVVLFVQMLGRHADQRAMDDHVYHVDTRIGRFHVPIGLQLDQLSICFVLLITGVGSLIHIYAVGYMAARSRAAAVLRLPQPVHRGDAAAGARRQLPGALRRLGGRGPGVLPADRLLVAQAGCRRPRPRRRSS